MNSLAEKGVFRFAETQLTYGPKNTGFTKKVSLTFQIVAPKLDAVALFRRFAAVAERWL
jgi:hypothetical protein